MSGRSRAAHGRRLGVLLLDVDRFREVNDMLGHDAGDDVLREVAKRLGRLVDQASFLARPAGDEFAVVFEYSAENEHALRAGPSGCGRVPALGG